MVGCLHPASDCHFKVFVVGACYEIEFWAWAEISFLVDGIDIPLFNVPIVVALSPVIVLPLALPRVLLALPIV